jgi:LPS export ABC transporter protein LptC/lipopolysaccharide transport protein LptA
VAVRTVKNITSLNLRAQLPKYFRIAAIAVLGLTLIAVGIGYYRAKSNPEFRMSGFPTELSKDVIATVHGYERRETDGEVLKYYIKADTATTFTDNHQELENVYLQVFNSDGSTDEITAGKAIYIPEENKNFTGYFAGRVAVSTRDKLNLHTEQITYSKAADTVTAEENVEFDRHNIKGRSFGGSLNLAKKFLQLNRDVKIEVAGSDGSYSTIAAGSANYDQITDRIEMLEGATLEKRDPRGNGEFVESRLSASRLTAHLIELRPESRVLERAELFDNVAIERRDGGGVVTINARAGSYLRVGEKFEANNDVAARIQRGETVYEGGAVDAVYEAGRSRVMLNGGAHLGSGSNSVSGDSLVAYLNGAYSLEKAEAKGNAKVHQASSQFVTDIASSELTGFFGPDRALSKAEARGPSEVVRTASHDNSKLTVTAANSIDAVFQSPDAFESLQSEGRTTVRFDTPDNGADSTNRSITADSVKTIFQPDGKTFQRAEAVGNAEFSSSPHRPSVENYSLRTTAARFDCDFFNGRNDPKICVGSNGTNTRRSPTVQRPGRGDQNLAANRLTINFSERSREIERLDAVGKAKFAELDRSAVAESFSFSAVNEIVQLRGGEPTAWDSAARIKAKEIDWDTRSARSFYRGGVSSTYYSTRSVGSATPFGDEAKPFYVTSEAAELDHQGEVGVFSGNARGWQGANYVRGDRLELRNRESQLNVFGGVQSMLYNARKMRGTADGTTPVSAAAGEMRYDGKSRTINYIGNVDIRQGADRMTGGAAVIQLDERNEMSQTNVDGNVAIVQAGRKAYGENFVYTAADDRLLLRGRPARVEDLEHGSSQGEELVIYLGDNRMTGEGRSKANPSGRVRNVYKVK